MGAYDSLLKEQLRDLCMQRELPVSGTNAELIARLEGWDDAHANDGDEPDLLAAAGIEPPPDSQAPPPQPPTPTPVPEPVVTHEDPPSPGEPRANQTVFRARFEVPGSRDAVIPTDLSQQFARATEDQAIRNGYRVRGGAARVAFEYDGGKRYAVYEVILGRPIQQVG